MPAQHNWSALAAKWDARISLDGVSVTLWHPARTIPGGVPVEAAPTLAGSTTALILQGGNIPGQPLLAGLSPEQFATAYFLSSVLAMVRQAAYLQDVGGLWWRLASSPDIQRASPAGTIVGISALLILQSQKPTGIP